MKAKKKINKWIKAIIIIVSSFAVLFAGTVTAVMINDSRKTAQHIDAPETTTSVYENQIGWASGEDDYKEGNITPVNITLGDKELQKFETYVMNINVDYDYDDVYCIDEALAELDKTSVPVEKHAHDIRVNGKLNAIEFYNLIKKNNKEYMKSDDVYFYEEYSDKALKKYCNLVIEAINDIYTQNPDFDIDSLCCYLYDFKILNRLGSLDLAAVELDMKNIHFNEEMIENWSEIKNNDRIKEETMYHEMMHLFQTSCSCNERNGETRIGIGHRYDNLKINPIAWYWLAEASAEMNACEHLKMDYVTYTSKIGYVDTLNFLLNINGTDNIANIQDLSFEKDFNKIFELFDMTERSQKEEFIKMMYSVEIIQQSPKDFTDWYSAKFGVNLSENEYESTKYMLCVKEDALMTMAKIFYRNLARSINNGNATLQDMYYLMRVFEADVDRHMNNNTVGYLIFFKDFYLEYLKIQDEFFDVISNENNADVNEIKNGFESYSINVTDSENEKSPNCDLAFLTKEQRIDVISFCNGFYKKGYPSMRKAKELCQEWISKTANESI